MSPARPTPTSTTLTPSVKTDAAVGGERTLAAVRGLASQTNNTQQSSPANSGTY
jgi:hypothetical protein